MSRAVEDQVYVRQGGPGHVGHAEASPAQFIWRDRLYVVQSVLGHWRERRSWWPGSADGAGDQAGTASTVTELAAAGDREVWRVQAGVGRSAAGVFELCAEGSGAQRFWRLLRVED